MNRKFYLTTPIFYPNNRLHLGHAYTMTIADIIVRYKKSKNYQTYLQTGSDEHGEKIEKKAASLNISPQGLVDNNVLLFQQLWRELGISEHTFYRTSSQKHQEKVQKIFTELEKKGDIYLGEYHGKYCITCEDYISDSKIFNDNLCPYCQAELRKIKEPAYFLKVNHYYSQLVEHYQQSPNFLLPENIKKEFFSNFLKPDIPDLCITRSDIKWGIPVPKQEKMIIYVWFEALLNYLNSESGGKYFFLDIDEKTSENDKIIEFSCVVIQNKERDFLLTYNKKWGTWSFPGGKLEKNETSLQAAKREVFEETNLIVEGLEKVSEGVFWSGTWKGYCYRAGNYSGNLLIREQEKEAIGEIKFFKPSEILQINVSESTKYFLEKLTNCEIIHLIGKEITRFHAIYWPIILFALNKRLPNKILAHGWLITPTGKMSKSQGNVIDPLKLLEIYPSDLLRVYFVAKINFLRDGVCSEELLKEFYQEFFINNLGNFCFRTGKMLELYNNNIIPSFDEKVENPQLVKYQHECWLIIERFQELMDNYQLTQAYQEIEKLLNLSNKLIQDLTPWEIYKQKNILLLSQVLNYLMNGIKIVTFLLNSIIPNTSEVIFQYLNINYQQLNWENIKDFAQLDEKKLIKLEKPFFPPLN